MRFPVPVVPSVLYVLFLLTTAGGCLPQGKEPPVAEKRLDPPPLPVLSPTALTADPGDGRAYLRWNLQLEDSRAVGWRVLQLEPEPAEVTKDTLTEPHLVVRGLKNGTRYTFAVAGILNDGRETPQSHTASVTPRNVGTAKIAPVQQNEKIAVGEFRDIALGQFAARIVFPDGQELVYDQFRPVDWKTRDGEHLIYPKPFGNGFDIGQFDPRGLPKIIPPGGLRESGPIGPMPGYTLGAGAEYRDVQSGRPHPYLTDPMTLPLGERHHDAPPRWHPPQIDGDRVTFHYSLPLVALGYRAWTYVLVWETWWPIERDRHGCTYHGLARLIEVEMPSALNLGYQVMLNNGFGPGGSRRGVVYYGTGFREPGREIVDFSGDGGSPRAARSLAPGQTASDRQAVANQQVIFQSPKPPRRGSGYHPDHDCLQASPLLFYDWGKGSLTISARSLYYRCANNSSSYIEQGADGVWPNLAWDMALAGQRTAVDTVEYLSTADTAQPLPQRYLNARFEVYGGVSRRMGVQDSLGAVAMDAPHSQIQGEGGPLPFAEKYARKFEGSGIDVIAMYHDIWHSFPIEVDDAYRFDEQHDCNPALKAMCGRLRAAGFQPGFWFRPEFTRTSLANALSSRIPEPETYYGYGMAKYPEVIPLLKARGIPLFRQHPNWVRRARDGSWPYNTPYQWVPMSLATEWWDRIIWPSLWMSARLGFTRVLVDGGFGGFQGVDYAPMLEGKASGAVACQPYWWRFWRSMNHVGIRMFGECTVGWTGGAVSAGGAGDECYQWLFSLGWYIGCGKALQTPELAHRTFQLYNSNRGDAGGAWPEGLRGAAVRRYARRFYEGNPPPDWIELKDLRQGEPVELTAKVGESPVAGGGTRTTDQEAVTTQVRPWTWSDVIWHYEDGRQVVYPASDKIDWSKE